MLGLGTLVPGGGLKVENARTYCGPIREGQRIGHGELLVALTDLTQDGIILGAPGIVLTSWAGEFVVSTDVAKVHVSEPDSLEVRFLYYLMRGQEFRNYVRGVSTGTTVRRVSPGDILAFNVCLPPIAEQRAVAHVLGSLDDKIELNRRMNQTLEEICRALFKFWFVDFGPVRAKMEGRWKKGESLPGMPADMWDLWPSEFEESKIGEIPKGWFVQQLADVAEISQGSTPNTEVSGYWNPPEHPWVTVKDLSQTQDYVLMGTNRKVSQKGLEYLGSRFVPPRSILLSTGAPIGYVAVTTVPCILGTRVVALRPQSQLRLYYLLHWVKTSVGAFQDAANGTTFPQLLLSALREFPILIPPIEVLSRFESFLSPAQERVVSNVAESASLASTRDALLPKLLSGEIRVKVDL
jgi:type I restriction enzyme S subunit